MHFFPGSSSKADLTLHRDGSVTSIPNGCQSTSRSSLRLQSRWHLLLAIVSCLVVHAYCMTEHATDSLAHETREIFYHGFDNYMKYAFPEDELRPITCEPLTRDRNNPAHIELNDALGNYSLTLIDSLSTLAILASAGGAQGAKALNDFQDGIGRIVEYYGDGGNSSTAYGKRAKGFDLDSKVQVFETVIRGVGGLLSAHLFAVGDLPIKGYQPTRNDRDGIIWRNGFVYDGQLLRLAQDLAERLLPAFHTATGLPYPRVNLRTGVPFYVNSPLNNDPYTGQCPPVQQAEPEEITETCSAGAGSLVLEFTTLSRLTGDDRFEEAAKRAFWAVWDRRTPLGLIGSGIDAESGQWIAPWTGIGAGIDSFFEYALKSHILLSGLPYDKSRPSTQDPDEFLVVWQEAHAAIKRHVYRGEIYQHPHYLQADIHTGALRASWIDSLSAYFQGLLTMAGKLEEAEATHLLHTALWSRYAALPERWSVVTGDVEAGLRWWGGRPEFIESTWYLYRATQDPWYLHVGEMALRDIKRRCWTKCGWAGLQDVRTGELMNRMESFFLGETAKYLYLLFDTKHPLNHLDKNWVFTTEGHPLVIPKKYHNNIIWNREPLVSEDGADAYVNNATCQIPSAPLPLTYSATAARDDLWHAANVARLHLSTRERVTESPLLDFSFSQSSISLADLHSPSNYTYFPWTLPPQYIPHNATSRQMLSYSTFDLSFPALPQQATGLGGLQRIEDGVLVNSMSGLRLGMIKEGLGSILNAVDQKDAFFRIYAVSSVALGRDEKVFVKRSLTETFNPVDPYFSRIKDTQVAELLLDVPDSPLSSMSSLANDDTTPQSDREGSVLSTFLSNIQSVFKEGWSLPQDRTDASMSRNILHITLPLGPGAAPLPELASSFAQSEEVILPYTTIHIHTTPLCTDTLPAHIARTHQILVLRRGTCNFSTKLRNIPSYAPSPSSLKLVIVVSSSDGEAVDSEGTHSQGYDAATLELAQPYLDEPQLTPAGLPRAHPIPLVMVDGGDATMALLLRVTQAQAQQRRSVGDGSRGAGVGVRRRWHYETMGVRIGNLIVV